MVRTISTRSLTMAVVLFAASLLALTLAPTSTTALPAYAAATGQACAVCHVNPAGGGPFTATGQRFAAVPTHATNPAAAWASLSAPAGQAPAPAAPSAPSTAPSPAAPAPPASVEGKAGGPAPAAPSAPAPSTSVAGKAGGSATGGGGGTWSSGPLTVMLSGAAMDSTVAYTVMLRNSGNADILNTYLAVSLPPGATLSGNPSTPEGAAFVGQSGGAAWIIDDIPAASANTGVVGPFVVTVSSGSAADLSASAFVHWLKPTEGSFSTPTVMPVTNDERMAIEQQVINRFNTADRTTSLWNIQPGLGTVMIEYSLRFANLWFAAQAGNWDMTRYQVAEMTEIQEVGETTRPGRAPALKNFEATYLDPLDEAAASKDLGAFVAAYDKAATGCNNCHSASTGTPPQPNMPAKFIKIARPTAPVLTGVDWKGQ